MPTQILTDGNDLFGVTGGNSTLVNYNIYGIGGEDTLIGGGGNDKIIAGDGSSFLSGLNGNNQLIGSFGDDTLLGGNGDDLLSGGLGNDLSYGGSGNDRIFASLGDDVVDGGSGNDTIDGSVGSDVLFGGAGNDNITGGTNGDPALDELGFFRDYIAGGAGTDTLNGFGGGQGTTEIDELVGGGAIDTDPNSPTYGFFTSVASDGVRDTFVLGSGQSVFYSSAGNNDFAYIYDFEVGIDKLQLSAGTGIGYATQNLDLFGDGTLRTGLFATLPSGNIDLIAIFDQVVNISLTTDVVVG
jgi:Ca2+-binding RTX toxin-like protein